MILRKKMAKYRPRHRHFLLQSFQSIFLDNIHNNVIIGQTLFIVKNKKMFLYFLFLYSELFIFLEGAIAWTQQTIHLIWSNNR
jgi:hypothetical protein